MKTILVALVRPAPVGVHACKGGAAHERRSAGAGANKHTVAAQKCRLSKAASNMEDSILSL